MSPFAQISLVIFVGASLGAIVSIFKQPPLIGYIIAGLLMGVIGLGKDSGMVFETMSQLGITLLLFLVGMELSFEEFKEAGQIATVVGFAQVIITSILSFILVFALGFRDLAALLISIAVTFSSTILVVKLLAQKNDTAAFYGKISLGILLFQDLVATIVLILLSGLAHSGSFSTISIIFLALKGLGLIVVTYILSRYIFPRFMRLVSLSPEMIFVTSIAWCLGLAAIVSSPVIGFSPEIGGFLAGLALANSSEHYQIISRIRPVRDFFVTIFFIVLGARMVVTNPTSMILPAILLSLFVLIGKPLIVFLLMSAFGFRKRTSFLTGVAIGQISEFSLILVLVGISISHISQSAMTLIAMVAVITMIISSYCITYAQLLYRKCSKYLSVFERKHLTEHPNLSTTDFHDHIILIGYNRSGRIILPALTTFKSQLLVVDFNPSVAVELTALGIPCLYGDIADHEFQVLMQLDSAKLVISTVLDVEDNLSLLEHIRKIPKKPLTVITAAFPADALRLYEAKADFVIMPHFIGGEHLAHLVTEHGIDHERFSRLGKRHFDMLLNEWGQSKINGKQRFVRNPFTG